MTLLIVSNIVLWLCVVALCVVVYLLTRQIGVLYERVAPAGALAVNRNIDVGQPAPELSVQTLAGTLITVGRAAGAGKCQLLFWVSPDCPVCRTLLPALSSAARAEADWLELVICSDGPEQDHAGYARRHGLASDAYVVSELVGKSYGVAKLPYAVVVDEEGRVASLGIINSREHLDSLFEAKERKVASIQDYMARRSGTGDDSREGAAFHEVTER